MTKALPLPILLVFGPLVLVLVVPLLLVAVVCVSPFVALYFIVSRICDCIEEYKPRTVPAKKKRRKLTQFGSLLNLLPNRGNNDNGQLARAT